MTRQLNVIDPSYVLKKHDGTDMVKAIEREEEPSPLTVRRVVQFALDTPMQEDAQMKYRDKWLLGQLSVRFDKDSCTLAGKDITTVMDRVSKLFGSFIVMQIKDIIDPEDVEQDTKPTASSPKPAANGKEASA